MTYYPDLGPCDYFDRALYYGQDAHQPESVGKESDLVVAVGWLDSEHELPRGKIRRKVMKRLAELLVDPWEPILFCGAHACELCSNPPPFGIRMSFAGWTISLGVKNLFVPGRGKVYAVPSLIAHYVAEHRYVPPREFCDAVRDCPPPNTRAYTEALSQNGPTVLREMIRQDEQMRL